MKYIISFLLLLFLAASYAESNIGKVKSNSNNLPILSEIIAEVYTDEFTWGEEITIKYEDIEKKLSTKNKENVVIIDIVYEALNFASAKEVEEKISRPLEIVMSEIEKVEHVYSESSKGKASILVQFRGGIEYSKALNIVQETLNKNNRVLPQELKEPVIKKNESVKSIISLLLWSKSIKSDQLNDIVSQLKKHVCSSVVDLLLNSIKNTSEENTNSLQTIKIHCLLKDKNTIEVRESSNALDSKTKVALAEMIVNKVESLKNTLIPKNVHVEVTRNYGEEARLKSDALLAKFLQACEVARKNAGINEKLETEELLLECASLIKGK